MKAFLEPFDFDINDDSLIDRRVAMQPPHETGLNAMVPDQARVRLAQVLQRVFVPTAQIRAILRQFYWLAKGHAEKMAGMDELGFSQACYERVPERQRNDFMHVLSGLAGIGKTEILSAYSRLLNSQSVTIDVRGLPKFKVVSARTLAIPPGGRDLVALLEPLLLDCQRRRNQSEALLEARKVAHATGLALLMVDESQFLTTSDASTMAVKLLLQATQVGVPMVCVMNYSFVNLLAKRPQQECDRLLGDVMHLRPDSPESGDWLATLDGIFRVIPELVAADGALNPSHHAAAIHRYTFGIKRYAADLIISAYCHARENYRYVVTMSDVESAYKSSGRYASRRDKVEALRGLEVSGGGFAGSSRSHSDLLCVLEPHKGLSLAPTRISPEIAELAKFNGEVNQETSLESIKQRELLANTIACLNPDELEQLAEDDKKLVRPAKKDSRVVPLRRRVVTKESLAEGFSASLNPRGKT